MSVKNKSVANLWIHDSSYSKQDIIIHPSFQFQVHDLVELTQGNKRVILQVHSASLDIDIISRQPLLQLSISQAVASVFGFLSRTDVNIKKIDPQSVSCDFVELSFRDQYIGRSDMWRLKLKLSGTAIYKNKKVSSLGIRAQIKDIFVNGIKSSSGFITDRTRMIFRSETAKYFIFIQMSREMWEFDQDGEMFYETCVRGFLPELFSKWKAAGSNHVVSIILFTRILYSNINQEDESAPPDLSFPMSVDSFGQKYRDFYRVVVDWESRTDWASVLITLKNEFTIFERYILERKNIHGSTMLSGVNSHSTQGNILEAINLALIPFDKHYIDRDLLRTGLSIIVVTPSVGVFQVNRQLCRLTNQRMIDNGICLDLVCLSKPPLFVTPLFQFLVPDAKTNFTAKPSAGQNSPNEKSNIIDIYDPINFGDYSPETNLHYWLPHWVDISFWSRECLNENTFVQRCKMSETPADVFESLESAIIIAPLPTHSTTEPYDYYSEYDDHVFETKLPAASEQTGFFHDIGGKLKVSPEMSFYKFGKSPSPDYNYSNARSGVSSKRSDMEALLKMNLHSNPGDSNDRSTFIKAKAAVFGPLKESKSHKSTATLSSIFSQSENIPTFDGSEISKGKSDFTRKNSESGFEENYYVSSVSPIKILSRPYSSDYSNFLLGSFKNVAGSPDSSRQQLKQSPGRNSAILPRPPLRNTMFNPCNPSKNIFKLSSNIRRWQHVYPRLSHIKPESTTNWKSLCTPACLPITTAFFPTSDDLKDFYQEYTYTVSPSDDFFNHNDKEAEMRNVESLLTELISQRLSQGFQLVSEITEVKMNATESVDGNVCEKSKNGISILSPYYLSLGDHIHRLFYDSSGKNVEVKRYVRRFPNEMKNFSYKCAVWSESGSGYETADLQFFYPNISLYNWNYLDHLISGYQDEMTDALKFWRTRYLLIPLESVPLPASTNINTNNEFLDDEEIRLAGFQKFLELFEKAQWIPDQSKRDQKKHSRAVNVSLTTLNLSQYVKNEIFLRGETKANISTKELLRERLTKNLSLELIALAMQNTNGVTFKDRRWHFQIYEMVFIGNECVDWMVKEFSDIETREDAVAFGNELMAKNFFQHVHGRHGFLDGHYFYRLKKEFMINDTKEKNANMSWFRARSGQLDSFVSSTEVITDSQIPKPSKSVEVSNRLVIHLDPQGLSNNRREIAILHYDSIYNSQNCFHFQIHWLTCTARLIENMLQTWNRYSEKCGLKLVEAPINQANPFSGDNPFQSVIPIKLALTPPSISLLPNSAMHAEIFERELLKKFNFVLDIESDSLFKENSAKYSYKPTPYKHTQFIHQSGVAIVQILPNGKGYLWTVNRLNLTSISSALVKHPVANNAKSLLNELKRFCNDAVALEEFWNGIVNRWRGMNTMQNQSFEPKHGEV